MLNLNKDMRTGQGLDPHRRYEAKVVANDDTKSDDGRMLCRVQARVAGLFDGTDDEDLPWALPTFMHTDGAGADSGYQWVPKVGTKVLLQFQDGSSEHPIYSSYPADASTLLEEMKTNYPDRKVVRHSDGFVVVIDTRTHEVFIRNPGAYNIFIQGDANLSITGNVVEKIEGNRTSVVEGDLVEIVKGNRTIHAEGNSTEIVGGARRTHAVGADLQTSDSTMERQASYINDAELSAGTPDTPEVPAMPAWPGIRGETPS